MLRRLRYTFNFNDKKMVAMFALADLKVSREQISQWLKKEDDNDYVKCSDTELAIFLNGFINDKRGKKEGPQHAPEKRLTNNIILNKLKIALNLKAEEIIELLTSVEFKITKPELSAFFRKPEHKHYRECKDQILRNFLAGIEKTHHVTRTEKFKKPAKASESTPDKVIDKVFENKTYQGASPKASAIYENPNKKSVEKSASTRKVLKLKPEDIWKS